MSNEKNPNKRYVGKVQNIQGQYGVFKKILVNNPHQLQKDGTPNTYYKGSLLWFDTETNQYYQVKQLSLGGVGQHDLAKGFSESVSIDLGDQYQVVPLNNQQS